MSDSLGKILADLTGREPPFPHKLTTEADRLFGGSTMGLGQLNEVLLLLGYNRISEAFFPFLISCARDGHPNVSLSSLESFRLVVDEFRRFAMLRFGNVRTAFEYCSALSTTSKELDEELAKIARIDPAVYKSRHDPLLPSEPIPGDKTYFLGYLVKRQLDDRIKKDPKDKDAKHQLEERARVVGKGKINQNAYLVSNHLDVYVATSMRERHEYMMVNQVVKEVFESPQLAQLKVRYFDPTQAYCEDRIDKGLSEGLMLKRAKCTLYMAQESDTLGKDSEFATTLAQGKTVIAYIPSVSEADAPSHVNKLIEMVRQGTPDVEEAELVLHQLRVFYPAAAWTDEEVQKWVADPKRMSICDAKAKLASHIREHYENRARTLKDSHPLGIQVHLETGVATGVLVARSTEQCAELIRRILTSTLEFDICEKMVNNNRYLLLKEKLTGSIYRVVTGDQFLTNAFWNFYLQG